MDYLWLKALHIVAVVTWIGGMLVVAVAINAVSSVREPHEIASRAVFLERVRRWDRRVTSPAMLLVWLLGLALALMGHWFPQAWLVAKLTLVLLSALHGRLSGNLRRLSLSEEPGSPGNLRHAAAAVVVAVFIIVVLVVIKPI